MNVDISHFSEMSKKNCGCVYLDAEGNVLYDPLYDLDEATLSVVDRLGLAYCRINAWKWDDILGPKPAEFDSLPNYDKRRFRRFRKRILTKSDYIRPIRKSIESQIGEANISRCYWMYGMKRSEEEWSKWYYTKFRL